MSAAAPGQKRHTLAALVLLGLAAAAPILLAPGGGGKGAGAAIDRCAVPPELAARGAGLPHTAARLLEGSPLTIVALGSSSTAGFGASTPERSYPSRLAALLKAQFPGVPIRVVNRGIGGEMSPQMLARLERDVLAEKPDLVIWQLGTNSTLHDRDPGSEVAVAETGIERIKAAHADVMLMDLQYAPAVLLHPTYGEMEVVLAGIARSEAVPLVRRFAMMRYWAENGRMSLDTMLAKDRLHMSDASYDCLARQVAQGIAAAENDEIAALTEE
jgi:lysophospholipase L1-like esterase